MAQNQQRYRVLDKIASGGMAEVFRAESAGVEGFKKTVAIKRVLPHLSEKKQFIGMFLDEARLSAHLSHSNCVQVFDIGMGDRTYFIVMEYVDGADLKSMIEQTRKTGRGFPFEEACLVCVKICEGLSYAHEARDGRGHALNIVHRDMSPPNVLITRYGEVKIVDFGLAKANSQLERSEPGIIKGKFGYLSPEAAFGQVADARTDVFAVGIIFWEMLAGRRLFLGESDLETVRQVQAAVVPPIRQFNPKCSEAVERVLARALARDPAHRYPTAKALGRDLNALMFQSGRAVSSFDIAQMVDGLCADRERQRSSSHKDRGAIIGSLIEEALFEFTSIEKRNENSGASPTEPISLQLSAFENVQEWASDIGELGGVSDSPPPDSDGPASLEIGNLAALEDAEHDSDRSPASSRRHRDQPSSDPPGKRSAATASKRRLWVMGAVVLGILAATAGAYRLGSASAHRPTTGQVR